MVPVWTKYNLPDNFHNVIASYLRQVWDKNDWLYEGQHGFRPGYSCESEVIMVCQDIADSLDNGDRVDTIVIDFSKAFDLVPHCLRKLRPRAWIRG
jgi:tRNA A58 N-methylase Trm61